MKIWRDFDRAALDRQYDTRSQLGDGYDAWTERWQRGSAATRRALHPRLDLAYGPHPRHRLDLFPCASATSAAPIAVFFHGGFWRARDKADYSYVAKGLGSLGCIVAVANYPLCPAASLDEIVSSVRAAVRWLIDHAVEFGGDPKRLYVAGHSAGAHLAAMCMCGDGSSALELPAGRIKGALLTSGLYELEPARLCFANADIRLDPDQVRRLSPVRLRPVALSGPVLVAYGTAETEEFPWQANAFVDALKRFGADARLLSVEGADHYTIVPQLAAGETFLLQALRQGLSSSG
jgi:arylformamidase